MEEKILVKSENYSTKKCFLIAFAIIVALAILVSYVILADLSVYTDAKEDYIKCLDNCNPNSSDSSAHEWPCPAGGLRGGKCLLVQYSSATAYAWADTLDTYVQFGYPPYILCGVAVLSLIVFFVLSILKSHELVITDKRIYGKTGFSKRVDLPLDSVSAVGASAWKGVSVATSAGKIVFRLIKNRDEIHECVSQLLIERQTKAATTPVTTIKQEIPQSNAGELKKYKELLDMGVISQEEFDAKKKQLLGL